METKLPSHFRIFINGIFNFQSCIDYSMLTRNYDAFRRNLYKELAEYENDQYKIVLESFRDNVDSLDAWINDSDISEQKLIFEKAQGTIRKDISIISVDINTEVIPAQESFVEIEQYFHTKPTMTDVKLFFHENGIGVFQGYVEITLAKEISVADDFYRKFVELLRNSFILSPELSEHINHVDDLIRTALSSFEEIDTTPIVDLSHLYPNEECSTLLWGHAFTIIDKQHYKEGTLPFGENTKNFLIVSHPDGLIDMNYYSTGFVHIGWGLSLAIGITPEEEKEVISTLNQLQFYWRSAQIFNDLVMYYLERYTRVKSLTLEDIKDSMDKIERLKVETELFSANKMDYIKMLSPLSHFIFQDVCEGWRINQMLKFFKNKMESLSILHQQGEDKINKDLESKRSEMANRLNILISILALLTLFSWAADSMGFLDETLSLFPSLNPVLIACKFLVVILTPIFVIAIFYMFFRIVTQMKKYQP